MEFPREKHLEAKEPQASDFLNLESTSPMPPVVIGSTIVKAIATHLSGAEGLSGLVFAMAQNLLLCFGIASANLHSVFAELET